MAGFRVPGVQCVESLPWLLNDGTQALLRSPAPGPVCSESALFKSVASFLPTPEPDVGFLFRSCLNPTRGLAEADYERAAKTLGVEIAIIRAVSEVETSGSPFDELGRPRILFERHYFHRFTAGRFAVSNARISAPSAGGYGKFSEQYGKLEEAYGLDADAALRSASWGRFQIMGDNHRGAGFASARQFVFAMTRSEAAHLDAFVAFVGHDAAMAEALRKKDWAGFARRYNGPGYRKNDYDGKLQAAYERFGKEAAAAKPAASAAPASNRGGANALPNSPLP